MCWYEQKIDDFCSITPMVDIHEIQCSSSFHLGKQICSNDSVNQFEGKVIIGKNTHKDTW